MPFSMRVAVLLLLMACGRATLQEEADAGVAAQDAGTQAPDAGPGPLKFLVVMNASQSLAVTDWNGTRATSLFALLDAQPANTSVFIELFAGSSVSYLTPNGFQQLRDLSAGDRTHLTERIVNLPGGQTGAVDLVMPLQAARQVIEADLTKQPGSRYRVVLITDGTSRKQDQALLCSDLISGLVSLGDVRLNVVHVNQASFASCPAAVSTSACSVQPVPENCSSAILLADQTLLHQLANLGHGGFHSYGPGDQVDFSLALAPE